MNSLGFYFFMLLFGILFSIAAELVYFKISTQFHFLDTPVKRSLHSKNTITGAGFIFPLCTALAMLLSGEYIHYRAFLTGLFLLTCISFLDDLHTLTKSARIFVQTLSVALLLWQTGGLFRMTIQTLIPAFIFVIGIINAYNFMDGINGMTGLYSFVSIATLFFLSKQGYSRLPGTEVFICLIASIIAFGVFNIRKKAICFAGDVGSITMGFIISFMVIQMMIFDDNGKWILLIGVYGLETVGTIFLRILRKENIGEAHTTHFFQYLVLEKKMTHLAVSLSYALVQLLINSFLFLLSAHQAISAYVIVVLLYMVLRLKFEGKDRLFRKYYI